MASNSSKHPNQMLTSTTPDAHLQAYVQDVNNNLGEVFTTSRHLKEQLSASARTTSS
jgi:hypothetical protein